MDPAVWIATVPCLSSPLMTYPDEPVSRIAPCSTSNLRDDWTRILSRIPGSGLKGDGFPHNVLGMLMLNPDTLGPFLDFWVTSKSMMGLSVREQELVILRIAVLYRSEYVWKHHVKVGREFGVDDPQLEALRRGDAAAFPVARERALLELADAFVERRCLPPELWAQTRTVLSPRDFIDLISLVSQYHLFALVNVCMQVQVEAAVADEPALQH